MRPISFPQCLLLVARSKAGQSIVEALSLGSVRYVVQILRSQSNLCHRGLTMTAFYHHFKNEITIFVLGLSCHLKGALDMIKTVKPMRDKLSKVR